MKIYTRRGDAGETGLFGGGRVPKDHLRVEAYGTVDELNAALGLAVAEVEEDDVRLRLSRIQRDLFALGAYLAAPGSESGENRASTPPLPEDRVGEMEDWIDEAMEEAPELNSFILPGGTRGASALHLARTVCRRAERCTVGLARAEAVDGTILTYLNRLSDLLFALARLDNHRAGVPDIPWSKDAL